jgi:IS5 family transposase
VHVIVDEGLKPISVAISPGNIHDSKMFNLYDKMKSKPEEFYGDSAYDTCEVRDRLEKDGVKATYL